MTVKLSNIQITNILQGLDDFIAKDKEVPIELSYAISKNVKEMVRLLEPFETERNKLLEKLEKDNSEETKERTDIEFNKLAQIQIEVPIFTIALETIKEIKEMTVKDFMALDFMIKESEDK